jgi:molecular chaperone GrpE
MAEEQPDAQDRPQDASEEAASAPVDTDPGVDTDTAVDLDPAAQLEVALTALTAAKDQALRAQAEMENLRRRSVRDVENAHKFALERFVKDLWPAIESLEKAEAARGDTAEAAEAVLEGVTLSLKMFMNVLEKQGVTLIDPHGETFDPAFHEAIAMLPMPHIEPNSVAEVLRKGFSLNGRLMQAAQVVVAQGPAPGGDKPGTSKIDEQV